MNDTYITVHKPCKGWSIQLIEFDIDFNEMMPSSNYPNGDLLEYACESEASAINEGLRTARDLGLAFNYTSTTGKNHNFTLYQIFALQSMGAIK